MFAIALDEIRTRRILREKTDCKQSIVESLYVTVIYTEDSDEKSEVWSQKSEVGSRKTLLVFRRREESE